MWLGWHGCLERELTAGLSGKALGFNPRTLRLLVFISLNFNLKGQRNLIF